MKINSSRIFGVVTINVLGKIIFAILSIFMARTLGPEEFGSYNYVLSIVALLSIPSISGVVNLTLRDVSENKELSGQFVKTAFFHVLFFSLLTLIVSIFYATQFISEKITLFLILLFLIPLRNLLSFLVSILNGFNYQIYSKFFEVILIPSLVLILSSIFLKDKDLNSVSFALLLVFSTFVSLIFIAYRVKGFNWVLEKEKIRYAEWAKNLLPFFIIGFLFNLNNEISSVTLGYFTEKENVGYFKISVQLCAMISIGLSSVNVVTMPNFTQSFKLGSIEESQRILTKGVRTNAVISLPVIFFLIFFGDEAITLVFGEDYSKVYIPLVILCIGQIFDLVLGSSGAVMNMTNHERSALKYMMIVFITNIALLSIFVPIYSYIGAAIATSCSLITMKLIMSYKVYKLTGLKTYLR